MIDEKTTVQNAETSDTGGKTLIEILFALRSHMWLIIIVTCLFAAGGLAYAQIRKPVYTAKVPVQFYVEITDNTATVDQYNSTNYIIAYFNTAVDVCKSGEVADRANVYYHYYLESHRDFEWFFTNIAGKYEQVRQERREIEGYEVTEQLANEYREMWFSAANIGTTYKSKSSTTTLFDVWVTSLNPSYAREMALIYAFSADVSLNKLLDFGTVADNATAGVKLLANKPEQIVASADMSKRVIVIIAFALGLLISAAAAYIMYLLDTTVTTKEQLEELTGVNLIAYIDELTEAK